MQTIFFSTFIFFLVGDVLLWLFIGGEFNNVKVNVIVVLKKQPHGLYSIFQIS